MCNVKSVQINGRKVCVADLKTKYIQNIADAAADCDYIDKVVMFGSATTERCVEESDIDLAVFGKQARGKVLTSAKYRRFLDRLSTFDDFKQTYDVLYFKTGTKNDSFIMNDISKGEILYAR